MSGWDASAAWSGVQPFSFAALGSAPAPSSAAKIPEISPGRPGAYAALVRCRGGRLRQK